MPTPPISDEIGAALGKYFYAGTGPSHTKLTNIFMGAGYASDDPYDIRTGTPNKETRVLRVVGAAVRRPERARELIYALVMQLRVEGYLDADDAEFDAARFRTLQRAFARANWSLSTDGVLSPVGGIDLTTGGRDALDEQIARLRGNFDDPGALLGTAKDLLEAVAKFVLEEVGMPPGDKASFPSLWHLSRERLGVLPQQVDENLPGAASIKTILQSSWKIAEQVNELRTKQGTGHGRTLPTGVSPELALLVVREACSVAEFMLTSLDRQYGRRS